MMTATALSGVDCDNAIRVDFLVPQPMRHGEHTSPRFLMNRCALQEEVVRTMAKLPMPEGAGIQMHVARTFVEADPAVLEVECGLAKLQWMNTWDQQIDRLSLHM